MTSNQTDRTRSGETGARKSGRELKVLLYDLECSPNIGYTWDVWQVNVIKIIEHRQIISVAWKWLGEKEVHVLALPDFPGYNKDHKNNYLLMLAIKKLMNKADIAIGHNVNEFDDRRVNTDFIKHKILPPPPHKTVDTLKVARTYFDFNFNSLGELGEFLGLGKKLKHWGFELWERCMDKDPKAWDLMKKYNQRDVALLEKIYYRIRPWILNHPNMNALDRKPGCPLCRAPSIKMQVSKRLRIIGISNASPKTQFVCQECGKYSTGKQVKGKWVFG